MAKVRARPENGNLYFDFMYRSIRCREQTTLANTPENKKRMQAVLAKIEAEITLGSFDYKKYFPNSPLLARFSQVEPSAGSLDGSTLFKDFVPTWRAESEVRWRQGTRDMVNVLLSRHLLPAFGEKALPAITRPEVLQFRAGLSTGDLERARRPLSPQSINHIMGLMHMIMAEAAMRFAFPDPTAGIKRLKMRRGDIEPFTLEEVRKIVDTVRADYRNYLLVRFFTGMRTAEIHGLKWRYVDFERRQILVRETFQKKRTEYTKTDGSQRDIHMSQIVHDALLEQKKATGELGEYVFCTRDATSLDAKNVTQRVWYPLLRHLGLRLRRPYQCRHTCATLWLAAGENPEWIARQMGHTTTEMLFRVYSRYIPNLTRKDGSAFDRLLTQAFTAHGGVPV